MAHSPADVSQKVADLANTKIAFACSGTDADKWIAHHFGKEFVSEVKSLPTGTCRVAIKVDTEKQGPINARINVPYVGNKDTPSDPGHDDIS